MTDLLRLDPDPRLWRPAARPPLGRIIHLPLVRAVSRDHRAWRAEAVALLGYAPSARDVGPYVATRLVSDAIATEWAARGDIVIIDAGQRGPLERGLWAIVVDDEATARLCPLEGGCFLLAHDELAPPDYVQVIGRAVQARRTIV